MKKAALFSFLLLLMGFLVSCDRHNIPEDDEVSTLKFDQLELGIWNVNQVVNNQYNSEGRMTTSSSTVFGEGTDRGVCTINFENGVFTMNDNGTITSINYTIEDNYVLLGDGNKFGVRELTNNTLELTTPSVPVFNPCDFTLGGDIMFLSR